MKAISASRTACCIGPCDLEGRWLLTPLGRRSTSACHLPEGPKGPRGQAAAFSLSPPTALAALGTDRPPPAPTGLGGRCRKLIGAGG